ncbi:hypothetical protein VNO77_24395 [Canavalia gladiata]|uniref:Oleosin 1-like n=1 Tax=Canavalia gladiata TaxID=3824 RepID=A0AAN9L9H2_CANGL
MATTSKATDPIQNPIFPPPRIPLHVTKIASLTSHLSLLHTFPFLSRLSFLSSIIFILSLSLSLTQIHASTFLSHMANGNPGSAQMQRGCRAPPSLSAAFLQKLQDHAPNSTQLAGIFTLMITGFIFFLLTGLSVAGAILGLIVFMPFIIVSSPIWIPAGTFLFFLIAGFFSMCGFGVAFVAALSWIYRYFRGLHPPGSDRVDYARSRIYDTATHVKDYAREYGGYLQSKVKDAAPGA